VRVVGAADSWSAAGLWPVWRRWQIPVLRLAALCLAPWRQFAVGDFSGLWIGVGRCSGVASADAFAGKPRSYRICTKPV